MGRKIVNMSRADDEKLLDWLRRRDAGESASSIGRRYGTTGEAVRIATNRVYATMDDERVSA